mgnify:CR=1 FL=1
MNIHVMLGSDPAGAPVQLDIEELLATRLLVQGNSGSGKSHLLKMLALLLENRTIDGYRTLDLFVPKCEGNEILAAEIRRRINMVAGGETSGYGLLTVRENLWMFAQFYGLTHKVTNERIEALLTRFRLAEHADTLTESYSHGMRQRLAFCAALLGDPQLFIADEPMVGLDVQGHRDVKNLFRELADQGKTVIITTHTLAVAEEVADRIAVVNHGRLIALGTMSDLRQQAGRADGNLEDIFLDLTEPHEAAA